MNDRLVYLGYIDNLRTNEWHVVGLLSLDQALASRARSTDPARLIIVDPDTYELITA